MPRATRTRPGCGTKALAFETGDPQAISETDARSWVRRSVLRLPLALVTPFAAMAALFHASV